MHQMDSSPESVNVNVILGAVQKCCQYLWGGKIFRTYKKPVTFDLCLLHRLFLYGVEVILRYTSIFQFRLLLLKETLNETLEIAINNFVIKLRF